MSATAYPNLAKVLRRYGCDPTKTRLYFESPKNVMDLMQRINEYEAPPPKHKQQARPERQPAPQLERAPIGRSLEKPIADLGWTLVSALGLLKRHHNTRTFGDLTKLTAKEFCRKFGVEPTSPEFQAVEQRLASYNLSFKTR